MPVTPFHVGPGVLLKAVAPRRVSLTAFAAANVAIDVESVANLLLGRYPVHATLHTFLAATLVGLAVGAAVGWAGRVRRSASHELRMGPALVGGLLGGASHPLLDGIMHADIRPFLPVSEANPLYRLIGLDALLGLCLAAGVLGVAGLAVRHALRARAHVPRQ